MIRYLPVLLAILPVSASAFTISGSGNSDLRGWAADPVSFKLNPAGCSIDQATLEQAIRDALSLWNGVPTSRLSVEYGGTTTVSLAQASADSVSDEVVAQGPYIFCSTNFTADSGGAPADSVPGVGTFSSPAGQIVHGYLILNSTSGGAANIAELSTTTLSIIMAHELGHVLGLGHTSDTTALMYYDASARTKLSLSQDDMDGISYLYPRSEPSGAFGCGTLAAVGAAGKQWSDRNSGPRNPPSTGSGGAAAVSFFVMLAILFLATSILKRSAKRTLPNRLSPIGQ